MSYKNLDEFLIRLEQAGELIYVTAPPQLTADHLLPDDDRALCYQYDEFPVVANLFGSERRMAWALGVEHLADLETRLADFIQIEMPPSLSTVMGRAGELMTVIRGFNQSSGKTAPVQAIHREPDMSIFPALHIWPEEPYPKLPGVQIIRDGCLGAGDVLIYDDGTLGVPYSETIAAETPVALALGGDPVISWAAGVLLPEGISPHWLAGWLRGRPVALAPALTQPLKIPAAAEIIIEGILLPGEPCLCGPLGGEDGFYIPGRSFARMQITAITHREGAVLPASLPGYWQAKATERIVVPLLKVFLEGLVDANTTIPGLVIASTQDANRPGQAQKIMHGLWGIGPLADRKTLIIVDAETDVHDLGAVWRVVRSKVDWRRHIMQVNGLLPGGIGGKMGIDATGTLPGKPQALEILADDTIDQSDPAALLRWLCMRVDWNRDLTINDEGVRFALSSSHTPHLMEMTTREEL